MRSRLTSITATPGTGALLWERLWCRYQGDTGLPGSTMFWVETTSARFSIERAHNRVRQVLLQPAFVEAGGDNEDLGTAPRQRGVGTETGHVLGAPGDVFSSVVRMPGAGYI